MKWIFIHPFNKHFLSSQFEVDSPFDIEETKLYKIVPTTKVFNLVKKDKKKLDN